MCHGYEWELMQRAYREELARRNRAKEQAQTKPAPTVAPATPATPAPRVKDDELVPV